MVTGNNTLKLSQLAGFLKRLKMKLNENSVNLCHYSLNLYTFLLWNIKIILCIDFFVHTMEVNGPKLFGYQHSVNIFFCISQKK